MRVLAGDIGGTNARLAIVEIDPTEAAARIVRERRYPSREFPGFAPIVERFLAETGERPERGAMGVAGPVVNGAAYLTNLDWNVSAAELAAAAGTSRVALINDFDAIGHGLALLTPADLETLQAGEPYPRGAKAVIGPGTGLGVGMVLWDGARYRVHPSEGGHRSFAPRDDFGWELFRSLFAKWGHVSSERVLSGPGIASIYRHLVESRFAPEEAAVRAEMEQDDPAAVIVRHATAGDDALCVRTLDAFLSALGAEAGSLALTVLATGGVYVAGGIAPRLVPQLRAGGFLEAFRSKGRQSALMSRIPVHVVMHPGVGLLGAASVAATLEHDYRPAAT